MNKCLVLILFHFSLANYLHHQDKNGSPLCYERWLEGYRLASGRPQKVLHGVSLRICEDECSNTRGCAAFAFGVGGEANGTCELATRTRDSRAATNESLTLSDVDKSHHYDVYIEKAGDHCFKTSALYREPQSPQTNGVPIDCFYRLMAGKRLSKIHVLKSVSVHSIQECQEACIQERSFSCRSISYRYMPTGYTYSVSNCELSSYTETANSVHDYIEDYDYDYFQREPHCKTTSSINSYGVCAVVIRRGSKLNVGLVKSSHKVNSFSHCEHLCATALFRCRAFSFRHTERGRENYFQRDSESCLLHDADIGRLPGHNIEANPDFDLYEMGRLMGAECILYDQYNRNRNGGIGHNYNGGDRNIPPVMDNRNFDNRPIPPSGSNERNYPDRNYDNRHYNYDRTRFNTNYPPDQNYRPGGNNPRDVCLVRLKADAFLAPQLSRATFPVKTIEECRIECIRSYDVLRFQCKVMSFRLTSNSGGSCQLSDQDHREFRESDYVPARDRYEGASVFFYDDRDPICRQNVQATNNDRYGSGYFGGGGRYSNYNDRYSTSGVNYNDRYSAVNYNDRYSTTNDRYSTTNDRYSTSNDRHYDSSRGRYGESRHPDNRYDDNYNRYGYFNQAGSYQGPNSNYVPGGQRNQLSSSSSGFTTSGNYGRYGSGGNYGNSANYPEYPSGSGHSTVNGERCLRSCRQNREAGFYYCQVDDQGSWDFCCRPDHFCGFSPGLSVSWCYVGTGPSQSIWRSCNHRYNEKTQHNVAYLHEGPPPTIHKLSNTQVANLTKDNALLLFKASAPVFPETSSSSNSEEVAKSVVIPPVILQSLQLDKKSDNKLVINKKEVINGLNVTSAEESGNVTRSNRRTPRTPTFTIVEQNL